MRVLTVPEFHRWVKQKDPDYYVFSSENNPSLDAIGLHISNRFRTLVFPSSSDRICLKDNIGTVCLEHVKEVHMYDDRESIGVVFDVVCSIAGKEISWRLIAD